MEDSKMYSNEPRRNQRGLELCHVSDCLSVAVEWSLNTGWCEKHYRELEEEVLRA